MKTIQQIIQDTYNTKPNFKEQVEFYGLNINDVGIIIYSHNPMNSNAVILDAYNKDSPIVLHFSKKDDKVMNQSLFLTHSLHR